MRPEAPSNIHTTGHDQGLASYHSHNMLAIVDTWFGMFYQNTARQPKNDQKSWRSVDNANGRLAKIGKVQL
ncbi:MAG: hypothetical protein ACO2ZM_04620 [Francisellaceae bacterium]